MVAGYFENHIVAGETDFDKNSQACHLLEQLYRVFFLHHINAMADAQGVATHPWKPGCETALLAAPGPASVHRREG